MNFDDIVNEAKKIVSTHPEQAKAAMTKAEALLDEKTGGKYTDQIHKGGDALEGQLGVPADGQ